MKKLLALFLALIMVLSFASLAACGETETAEKETEATTEETATEETTDEETFGGFTKEELEASLPGEHIMEKLEAGMEVIVEFTGFVDNDAIMNDYAGAVEEYVTSVGASFSKTHADGDVTQQISQIENFTEMGVNMIVMVPPDGATLKDVVTKAMDKGILVVSYGAADADYCLNTYGDQRVLGYLTAEMAYEWIKKEHPDATAGSIDVAVIGSVSIAPMVENYNAMIESVNSHDILNLAYCSDACEGTLESGFNLTENACTANPNIRYFILQTSNPGVGANNYIMSQSGINPEEWGVFTAALEGPVEETMALASEGGSVLRSTIAGAKSEGSYIAEVVEGAFKGEISAPYELQFYYSSVTQDGWDCLLDNNNVPAAK